jgi:hypothetical protein
MVGERGRRTALPLRRFVEGKVTGLRRVAPLYVPSWQPAGRNYGVHSAQPTQELDGVSLHEAMPSRSVRAGNGRYADAAPIHAVSITAGELVTDGRGFAVFATSSGRIVPEISEDYRGVKGEFTSLRAMQRAPATVRLGRCHSLLTGGGGVPTYFHWLYDVLPRFLLLERAGVLRDDAVLIVPELRYDYQRDSLERLGVDRRRCFEVRAPTRVVAEEIVATTGHRNYEYVEPWTTRFLADRLGSPVSPPRRRIYINRHDAELRKLTNEQHLERALGVLGIESVGLDGLPFVEQVELFASADLIVGPHGAGLSNIAFCSPGTRVVELLGDGLSWSVYEHLARDHGLRYDPVEALQMDVSRAVPDVVRRRLGRVWDARVDVERAAVAVQRLIEEER